MKAAFVLIALLLASVAAVHAVPIEATQARGQIGLGTNPDSLLSMVKLQTVATQVSSNPTCYFPVSVYVNVTWTGQGAYGVDTSNFWLVITAPNLIVGNSTISSFQNPNNRVIEVTAFSDVPVTFQLTFPKTCLPQGVSVLPVLLYRDGTYNFEFSLP